MAWGGFTLPSIYGSRQVWPISSHEPTVCFLKDSWTSSDSFNLQGPASPRGQELGTWLLKVSTMSTHATGGRHLPGPESELSSNTWKWIVQRDTHTDKTKDFIGKGVENVRVREPRRTALHMACCLRVYGGGGVSFWIDSGQSSCLWSYLVWSGFFLVGRASLSQDGFQREGVWEVGRIYRPPDQDLL